MKNSANNTLVLIAEYIITPYTGGAVVLLWLIGAALAACAGLYGDGISDASRLIIGIAACVMSMALPFIAKEAHQYVIERRNNQKEMQKRYDRLRNSSNNH